MLAVGVVPLGELPADRGVEVPAGRHQSVVQHRAPHVARRARLPGGPDRVAEQHAELLDGAVGAKPPGGLVAGRAVDGVTGDIDGWHAVDDPVRHHGADAATGEDAE